MTRTRQAALVLAFAALLEIPIVVGECRVDLGEGDVELIGDGRRRLAVIEDADGSR